MSFRKLKNLVGKGKDKMLTGMARKYYKRLRTIHGRDPQAREYCDAVLKAIDEDNEDDIQANLLKQKDIALHAKK